MTQEQVFLAALDLPDATARAAYLDKVCGEDAEFRRQVEALLAAHFRTGDFLDVPAAKQVHASSKNDNTLTIGQDSLSADKEHEDESDDLVFLSPSTRPDSLGRLGHYEMLQVLGRGGFGIVFRAFDDMLQRVVAVKVMAPQIATLSPARKRFLREARSSAAVRHENVVHVYEVGEQPLPYLVMEFIPGETLQQKLDRSGPLDVPEVLRIGRQIAEGLAAAHASDLIHRDIKPGNILLEGGSHKVKVTDFGLARAADDASISQSGVIAGTPMFMAPEQALGHAIDQRADLFSLGSVLYQMASGRPPFRAPSALAVLKRVAEEPPRPIAEIIPETPDWLCGIIAKLHAKNPADRFQSAREVAALLADCEAKLKAKQEVKNAFPTASVKPAGWKWVAAAAVALLIPGIPLAVLEVAGVTHLFQWQQATNDPNKSGSVPALPAEAAKEQGPPGAKAAGGIAIEPISPPLAVAPFNAAQAKKHQEAWATHLGVPVAHTNSIGMKMRLIPPGEFMMGAAANDGNVRTDERPQHKVKLTKPILLGVHEVTVGQFRAFVEATGYKTEAEASGMGGNYWDFTRNTMIQSPEVTWAKLPFEQAADSPVCCVSWNDAQKFCEWLSRKDGRTYFLPTEAQWEFACRAGTTTRWPFGNDFDPAKANVNGVLSLKRPCAVGSYPPNAFGLCDMIGNVHEWCQDDLRAYGAESAIDPTGPVQEPPTPARRGGAYSSHVNITRSASRGDAPATRAYASDGFRVAAVGDRTRETPPLAVAPFDASRAKEHQAAWAKHLGIDVEITNSIGMKLRLIPPGKFVLHPNLGLAPERTSNELSEPFCAGMHEVTVGQFRQFVAETAYKTAAELDPHLGEKAGVGRDNKYCWNHPDFAGDDRLPVACVTWHDGMAFCRWLSKKENRTYRLPTEAEWIWLARAGSPDRYFFGNDEAKLDEFSWHSNPGAPRVSVMPIGQKRPNPWGLYDVHGNVGELCYEWLSPDEEHRLTVATQPNGPGPQDRLLQRGGGYFDGPDGAGFGLFWHVAMSHIGFRVVMVGDLKAKTPPPETKPPIEVVQPAPTIHDTWLKALALLPVDRQGAALAAKMKEQRPGFEEAFLKAIATMSPDRQAIGVDVWLKERKPAFAGVEDAWLKALPAMSGGAQAPLVDAWLRERKPALAGFEDAWLKTLPAMPADIQVVLLTAWLKERNPGFDGGGVAHKAEGKVVTSLEVPSPFVQDLSPLRALSGLKTLTCRSTVGWDHRAESDAAILKSLKMLQTVNGKPVAQFWKDALARQQDFKEWLQLVSSLDAKQQAAAVEARLKQHNPGADLKVFRKIEEGVVTELAVSQGDVADISPVRALVGLKSFSCDQRVGGRLLNDLSPLNGLKQLTSVSLLSTPFTDLSQLKDLNLTAVSLGNMQVSDLTPLKDMKLTSLNCSQTKVTDLAPLKDMKLTSLRLSRTRVTDLTPLKGMPLTFLSFYSTGVKDLAPLKDMPLTDLIFYGTGVADLTPLTGMPLTRLHCSGTDVTDLSPLKGMLLEEIRLTPRNITRGLDILRDMKSLKTIGIGPANTQVWPAPEFWERYDKGEFKN